MLKNIGFAIMPGFRASDVVGVQAVLGINILTHRTFCVGPSRQLISGRPALPLVADVGFDEAPRLDVLVVGEQDEAYLSDKKFLAFVKRAAEGASFVIAVSNGVLVLARLGLLSGREATADSRTTPLLEACGAIPMERDTFVRDGRFFTAGPSTGAIEAAFAVMRELTGTFFTKYVELNLEYAPVRRFSETSPAAPPPDTGLKVAVLAAPNMYVPDVIGAVDVLGALPGSKIHYVWKDRQVPLKGIFGPTLIPDTTFDKCPQMDVLIAGACLPGICADSAVLEFFRSQAREAKAIISVCAGSLIVGAAGLLKGEVATSNFHMTSLLGACGARPAHQEVAVSGKIYSAGPAIGSYESALLAVADIFQPAVAAYVERDVLEYSPHPIFGVGTPKRAGCFLTAISRAVTAPLLPFYSWQVKTALAGGAGKLRLEPSQKSKTN